jgi:hypothetical protein
MRKVTMLLLVAVFVCGGQKAATAQSLETIVTVSTGSGLSLGGAGGEVVKMRSPLFTEIDVGLVFDGDRQLEWTPGIIVELEGRVSLGFNPQVKRVMRFGPFGLYGSVGVPMFFAPFTLVGVEAALGGFWHIFGRLGVAAELKTDVFFAGTDIPESGIFAKIDFSLGIRVVL